MLPSAAASIVRFGEFTFDRGTRLLRRGADEIPLPPRVLGVLELLLERAGDVVPRQTIIDSVWKDAFVTDTSLAEAVSFLRQALGDDPQSPTYIQTVHRRGYRFVAQIAGATAPRPQPMAIDSHDAPLRPSIGGALVPWSVAVFCALAASLAIWQLTHRRGPIPPVVRVRIDAPSGTSLDSRGPALAISPDGSKVVFAACDGSGCRLYVRAIDRLDNAPIAGTDDASAPFFSPDGRWIGFFGGGKLKKVALSGGAPVVLADAPQTFGAAWLPDNAIVFADSRFTGLKRVSDSGGTPAPLTEPATGELGHAWPAVLPGGRALMFSVATSPLEPGAGPIAVVQYQPGGQNRPRPSQVIVDSAEMARAAGSDYIAYSRGGDLHALPFDRLRLAAAGAEQAIVSGVGPLQFAVSESGALVYGNAPSRRADSIWTAGSDVGLGIGDIANARAIALSPDGGRVSVVTEDDTAADIWIKDLSRGATTRVTHGGINVMPVWSEDGTSVFYASRQGGRFEIWQRDSGATAAAVRRVSRADAHVFPTSVAAGVLVFTAATHGAGIWTVPMTGGTPTAIVDSSFDDAGGALSPDGRLLAYQSDESGRWEIYLLRLGDKRRTAVSAGGGTHPFWSQDGRTLFYTSGNNLMRATVSSTGEAVAASPVMALGAQAHVIGVRPDGRVSFAEGGTPRATHAVLTLEWVRELRQLLGPPGTVLPR